MSTTVLQAAKNLSLPERLELLDALWESIVEEGYEPPLTKAHADEDRPEVKSSSTKS